MGKKKQFMPEHRHELFFTGIKVTVTLKEVTIFPLF